jgi:hypothetical protein
LRLSLLIAALMFAVHTGVAVAAPCPEGVQHSTVFFGNGIFKDFVDARNDADRFRETLTSYLDQAVEANVTPECFRREVVLSYAFNNDALDLVESIWQRLLGDSKAFWGLWASDALPDWWNDSVQDYLESIDLTAYTTLADLRKHEADYRAELVLGRKVVLVAHSQGNLFGNGVYPLLFGEEGDSGDFAMISVASPDHFVSGGGPHVTLPGDLILAVPGRLDPNIDPLGSQCAPIPGLPGLPGLHPKACHSFMDSYMKGVHSGQAILEAIKAAMPPMSHLPPVAVDDVYSMFEGRTLVVPARGVLVNDQLVGVDARVQFFRERGSGSPPPAGLGSFTNVDNGSGGFIWDLTGVSAVGEFTFYYVVHSGAGDSNIGMVTATVKPLPSGFEGVHTDTGPGVSYGRILVESNGGLYAPRTITSNACGFGVCEIGLQKIRQDGSGWLRTPLSSDALAPLGLAFGLADRVYFQGGRSTLSAFTSDGSPISGWPVTITDAFNPSFRSMFVDDDTQQVHLAAFSAFVADPVINVSLFPDGSEAWRLSPENSGSMFRGVENDLYVFGTRMSRVNRVNGQILCSASADTVGTPLNAFTVGSPEGVFGSFHNEVYRIDGNCQKHVFATWSGSSFSPVQVVPASDLIPDSPLLIGLGRGGTILNPGPPVFSAISFGTGPTWSVPDIEPVASRVDGIHDGVLFIQGWDRSDGLKRKLFLVSAASGLVHARLDLTGTCQFDCNVTVSESGEVYVADGNAIYKMKTD